MDASTLEAEQASIEEDILKLQLHSVSLNLNWDDEQQEEEEEDDDQFNDSFLLSAFEDPDKPSTSGINVGASTSGLGSSTEPPILYADMEDEEDDLQEGEEGELIDLSVDLEANPPNLLKLNIAYQEVIQQQLLMLDELIEHNKVKQEELESEMEDFYYNTEKQSSSARPKSDLGLLLAPFFKTNTFPVHTVNIYETPPHPDVNRRFHELGQNFMENPMPPIRWKKEEEKKLEDAVRRVALRQMVSPLLSQLEYLEEKFSLCKIEEDSRELKKKITEVKRKIETAKQTDKIVLLGGRNDKHDWAAISNIDLSGVKTPSECALYWQNHLHPAVNKKPWNAQEEANMKRIVRKHKEKDWKTIADELGTGRTPLQCVQRYQRNNPEHKAKPWTPEEDARLKYFVEKYKAGSTIPHTLIALKMGTRNGNQVCFRWTKTVDPTFKRTKWTADEDIQLLKALVKFGPRWSVIRDSGYIPHRNDAQCRERWNNVLRNINRDPFTKAEDKIISDLVEKDGEGHWSMIALALDRRTDNQVLSRWKYIKKCKQQGVQPEHKKKISKTLVTGLTEVRQKLVETIENQIKRRKEKTFDDGLPEKETVPVAPEEEESSSSDLVPVSGILPANRMIRIRPEAQGTQKLRWMGADLQQRMKNAKKPEEMIELYREMCDRVAYQKEQKLNPTNWIRSDKIINNKIQEIIAARYHPFKKLAMTDGSNINQVRRKALSTLKKITAKVMFIHYVKAMNINAERTLNAIKDKDPVTPTPTKTGAKTRSSKNGTTPQEEEKTKEDSSPTKKTTPETSTTSTTTTTPFTRNTMLHLCAPNRSTMSAYRRLVQDRERRVKTAKLMLVEKNDDNKKSKSKGKQATIRPAITNGHSTTTYTGEKYHPEELMKNIQLMPEHRILRSRFVSLFAWPTVFSTLVPYERSTTFRTLKPAVRIKRKLVKRDKTEDSDEEDDIPTKRSRTMAS